MLVTGLILLAIATFVFRTPSGDDAWFAEQSYWLLKDGVIRSEFFSGLNGWDNELLVSHKLFLWIGAALMHFFGTKLPVVQFTGLIFFVVFVAEILFYLRSKGEKGISSMVIAMLFLVFANRLLVKMSFQNRPEMMLAALGFGSFLLIYLGKRDSLKVFVAGILAGLAFVTHMNGVIYLVGGFVTLLLLRQYKNLLLFSLSGAFAGSLYLFDILDNPNGLTTWVYQFTHDPAASHGLDVSRKLIQLVSYPRLFFHSPEQMSLSILFLFVLWRQRKLLDNLPRVLTIYTVTIVVSFWLITKSNSAMYMILFIPWMLIILYETYKLKTFVDRPFILILLGYLVVGVFGMVQLILKNIEFRNLPESYATLRDHIPDKSLGLVPLTFFFNEYEAYENLLAHENYKLQFGKKDLSSDQMADWAYKNKVSFILYDYKFLPEGFYPEAGKKLIPHFSLAYYNGRFAVYSSNDSESRK